MLIIVVAGMASSLGLWALGFTVAALAILGALPISLINRALLHQTLRCIQEKGRNVTFLASIMSRMVLSGMALLVGWYFGLEALLGVLYGLLIEVFSYFGKAIVLVFGKRQEV